jgi:peptidoglycan/LPS O-acetylase OafA/YrhL
MNLLLLQSWVPVESFGSSLNGVSWSLCCEAFFYLTLPFLVRFIQRRDLNMVAWVASVALVVVAVVAAALMPHEVAQQFLYKGPGYRIGAFILGITLAIRLRRGDRLRISVRAAVVLAVCSYVFALAFTQVAVKAGLPDLRVYGDLITLPAAYVLIAAAARSDLKGQASVLRHPFLIRLGDASFALYMTHYLLLSAWVGFVGEPPSLMLGVAEVVCLSAVAVLISLAAYKWLEHPAEKALRARIGTPLVAANNGVTATSRR